MMVEDFVRETSGNFNQDNKESLIEKAAIPTAIEEITA